IERRKGRQQEQVAAQAQPQDLTLLAPCDTREHAGLVRDVREEPVPSLFEPRGDPRHVLGGRLRQVHGHRPKAYPAAYARLGMSRSGSEAGSRRWFGRRAKGYERGLDSGWLARMQREALAALELGPEDRFLDVGCGPGATLRQTASSIRLGVGIDLSPE